MSIEDVQADLVKLKRYNVLVLKWAASSPPFNPALKLKGKDLALRVMREQDEEDEAYELAALKQYFGGRRINEVGIMLVEEALKLYMCKPRGLLDILRGR